MFSIVAPMDINRLEQFKVTKRLYDKMPQVKEFLIPTRSYDEVLAYLKKNKLMKDVRLLPYEHEIGFNPAKALNIGTRNAKYDQVIITSPEVKPVTDVLHQLEGFIGQNVICQVHDENEEKKVVASLVHKDFRSDTPAMYFLAMFNKKDLEVINGWDEEFMRGYAYEDNDFGERWKRAGLPFIVVDEIQGIHQYHQRLETIPSGAQINFQTYQDNNNAGIIACEKGLNSGKIQPT